MFGAIYYTVYLLDWGLISGLGPIGAGLYGFFNRLLISTGLHPALNSIIWFDSAGINDIENFEVLYHPGEFKGITGISNWFLCDVWLPVWNLYISMYFDQKKRKTSWIIYCLDFCFHFLGVTEP